MKTTLATLCLAATFAATLALTACGEAPTPPTQPQVEPDLPPTPAATADPSLPTELPQLDADGIDALVAESAANGQITVIDFWATWCAPCVAMFPKLHEGLVALGDKVRPVSITLDAPGKYEQAAIDFLAAHHALKDAYLLAPDTDKQSEVVARIGDTWQDLVVPAVFVYDASGTLIAEFVGGGQAQPILQSVRENLLISDNN
ncbi:TlpA family protein disulfide reductase [Mucisphaera sp.]|uniref:TlpA family protein disulfide reductase n=1 Tax=Mucisphaera sp. TaxID=2913024 RepID=UPI003D099ED9